MNMQSKVVRRTVSFDDETLSLIDDWRRSKTKIPCFSKAVNELIRKAAKTSFDPAHFTNEKLADPNPV